LADDRWQAGLCGRRYGMRTRVGPVGEERRSGVRPDDPPVHDVTIGGGTMRQGVQTKDCDPVQLYGTEPGRVRRSPEGTTHRGPYSELVPERQRRPVATSPEK